MQIIYAMGRLLVAVFVSGRVQKACKVPPLPQVVISGDVPLPAFQSATFTFMQ